MDTDDSIMENNDKLNNKNHLSIDIIGSYTNNTPEPHIEFEIEMHQMDITKIIFVHL